MKRYMKYLRLAPWVILVFCVVFASLNHKVSKVAATGINTQLPQAVSGRELLNKKLQYEAAERDSVRKAQFERQDPYRRDSSRPVMTAVPPLSRAGMAAGPAAPADPRAEQVLEQLRRLQQSMSAPRAPLPGLVRNYTPARPRVDLAPDTTGDARVGQLNSMLDKVIRIQHPEEGHQKALGGLNVDEVLPADSGANTIAAVIASDQTLTSGATVALRIVDSIRVNSRLLPAGQLVYGTVTINNDRMLVHVASLREDRSLFVTDLQVYDLDGIAGIHIPGVLSRDVAKQSADQGVSSLNVLEADPSLGAQAANAGIQTVKTFVGRKVKQVRVSVRAGYQVLLRDAHPRPARDRRAAVPVAPADSGVAVSPPGIVPDGPAIAHCRAEGMRLRLRGLWLSEGRLWFGLEWENRGAIGFRAGYARWFIRDRRQVRRTAIQELPLEPLSGGTPEGIAADSVVHSWTAFNPFALARDKELVLEVAEKGSGRVLELVIKHQELLKAKNYVGETGEATEAAGDRPL